MRNGDGALNGDTGLRRLPAGAHLRWRRPFAGDHGPRRSHAVPRNRHGRPRRIDGHVHPLACLERSGTGEIPGGIPRNPGSPIRFLRSRERTTFRGSVTVVPARRRVRRTVSSSGSGVLSRNSISHLGPAGRAWRGRLRPPPRGTARRWRFTNVKRSPVPGPRPDTGSEALKAPATFFITLRRKPPHDPWSCQTGRLPPFGGISRLEHLRRPRSLSRTEDPGTHP